MPGILFVEDDEMIASGLVYALTEDGFAVTHRTDVATALEAVAAESFALGLLDLSLPDGTGHTVCRALKAKGVPVVFLTAVDDEGNVVHGLESGADDYIVKPFRLRELIARIRAVLRRTGAPDHNTVVYLSPDLEIHTLQAKVFRAGEEIGLTAMEYRLLLLLAGHRGQVLSRGQLLEGLWDVAGDFVEDNTLTVYIKRLREKLGDDGAEIVQTVRGLGYQLNG